VEGLEEFTPAPGMLATLEKLLHEAVQHGTLVSKMNIGQIKKAKEDIGKAKNVVKLDNDLYVNADYLANIVRLMKDADFYVCRDGKSLPQLYVYDGYYHTEALLMPVRV
jgi:UDP-N-acetylglucosamine:LPS N-acetylglucosamine transferase